MPIPLAEMQQRRNGYRYPAVALLGTPGHLAHVTFDSTHGLDSHFNGLLHSPNSDDKLLGHLGIIYWGHYSGATGRATPARALGKAKLAYYGQDRIHKGRTQRMRGVLDIGVQAATHLIDGAAASIASGRYSDAVSELVGLPGISFAFATKICAFISPEQCGVADSLIAKKYKDFGFVQNTERYIKNTSANRANYQRYCIFLQETANALDKSQYSNWTDRDGVPRRWRAVDVERALY